MNTPLLYSLLGVIVSMIGVAWGLGNKLLKMERLYKEADHQRSRFYFEIERLEASNNALRVRLRGQREDYEPLPVATIAGYRGLASGFRYKN